LATTGLAATGLAAIFDLPGDLAFAGFMLAGLAPVVFRDEGALEAAVFLAIAMFLTAMDFES
jgi:hypothetical protein